MTAPLSASVQRPSIYSSYRGRSSVRVDSMADAPRSILGGLTADLTMTGHNAMRHDTRNDAVRQDGTLFRHVGVDRITEHQAVVLADSGQHLGRPPPSCVDRIVLDIRRDQDRAEVALGDILDQTALVPHATSGGRAHGRRVVVAQWTP